MPSRSGQSIIEVLIAVAIGAILILGVIAVITPSLKSNRDVELIQIGAATGKDLADNVKTMADNDWHRIDSLDSSSLYFIEANRSIFEVVTGTDSFLNIKAGNLRGFWKFDEGTGSAAYDSSGFKMDGTLYNDASRAVGKFGNALSFGGVTSQVVMQNSSSFKYTGGDMTVSLWIKPDNTDDGGALISKPWNGSGQYNFYLTSTGGANPGVNILLGGATTFTSNSSSTVAANSWNHVAVVLGSDKSVKFYINGSLATSTSHSITDWTPGLGDSNLSWVIGCIYPYASNNCGGSTALAYKGLLDDVRIYTRTFNDLEIRSMYQAMGFVRNFKVEGVNRDSSGKVTLSGGTNDPSTKKVTVYYSWESASTSTIIKYITRNRNKSYLQTDWSGGPGQTTATTSINSKFSSSTNNVNYSSTTGSIKLNL